MHDPTDDLPWDQQACLTLLYLMSAMRQLGYDFALRIEDCCGNRYTFSPSGYRFVPLPEAPARQMGEGVIDPYITYFTEPQATPPSALEVGDLSWIPGARPAPPEAEPGFIVNVDGMPRGGDDFVDGINGVFPGLVRYGSLSSWPSTKDYYIDILSLLSYAERIYTFAHVRGDLYRLLPGSEEIKHWFEREDDNGLDLS